MEANEAAEESPLGIRASLRLRVYASSSSEPASVLLWKCLPRSAARVAASGGWLAAPRTDVSRRAMLKGRGAELRDLDAALADVRARGIARAITILGAAGIGKCDAARARHFLRGP